MYDKQSPPPLNVTDTYLLSTTMFGCDGYYQDNNRFLRISFSFEE